MLHQKQDAPFAGGHCWPAVLKLPCLLCVQGRPDKPDIRVCRLPDIKRKMNNRRASVKDGGE